MTPKPPLSIPPIPLTPETLDHERRFVLTAATATAVGLVVGLQACTTTNIGARVRLQESSAIADEAPAAPREFRAAWVATVANIDWPSSKGLSSAEQQAQIRSILDQAAALRLNAIILQVRPSADAIYPSGLEPWSEYLSGTQGQAPNPAYDPLALWISEAHARNIELHAWLNPFRARQTQSNGAAAPNHVSQAHPAWVKAYGKQLWLDPSESAAVEHTVAVFMDLLARYDVDGIHIDDYFYPYPVASEEVDGVELDFPDLAAWQQYRQQGGVLSREAWRRDHVNRLVERLYHSVHQAKPWVRFGISPFGIGKPSLRPKGIEGFSQYDKLYADVELWLQSGWLDYLAPQLYWQLSSTNQGFATLLQYWQQQNTQGRHIWPGLFTSKISARDKDGDGWKPQEINEQINAIRSAAPNTTPNSTNSSGHAHFSMVALLQNRQGIADLLKAQTYSEAALPPACPWLEAPAVAVHSVQCERPTTLLLNLQLTSVAAQRCTWGVWLRFGTRWQFYSTAVNRLSVPLREGQEPPNAIVVSAIGRNGVESRRLGFAISG